MNWWKRLLERNQLESQLDRELRYHFDRQVDDLIRSGMSRAGALRQARLDFGGLEQVKEECREARGTLWIENAIADLRFSVRTLRKSPGFAIVAIATLALGIGANTAMFSVLNAVFLRPLPYAHPERLVWVAEYFPRFKRIQAFIPEYVAWRQQNTAFERLEAYGIGLGVNFTSGNRAAERVEAAHITPGFFAMLGVHPQLGRSFAPEEDQPGRNRVAILSDALWRGYFNADPQILGRTVSLNGAQYNVVGVMPAGFTDLSAADTGIWLPDAVDGRRSMPGRAMAPLAGIVGRLKPRVTADAARANLEVIARRMVNQYPAPWSRYFAAAGVRVLPLQARLTAGSRTLIYVLVGAVGFVLLIVCANLANVFLSRAVAREKEIALRAAIGASRSRLVGLLLTESLLLGVLGGLTGMALMLGGICSLGFLMPATMPQDIPIDLHVLGFAAFCSVATSILFGLAPALVASRFDLNTSLKEGRAHAGTRAHGRSWFRGGLAAAQVALSLVLLAGAGLLLRSFLALMSVDPGFNPRNVLLADISLAPQGLYHPALQVRFFTRALAAIRNIPGVEYAAVTDESPLVPFQALASGLAAEGGPETDATVVPTSASADYFKALQIPLRQGRFFNAGDRDGAPRVAIVNQALAGILFPGLEPVGRRIRFGNGKDPWVMVVGVVGDIRHRSLDDSIWPELYRPFEQAPSAWMTFVIRTAMEPSALVPAVRKAVSGIDRSQPLFNVQSLEQRLSGSVAQRRRRALLLGSFAFLALAIAVVGVYGVMTYSVARRTHELGIRIALGAQPGTIVRNVVAQGTGMALIGVACGLAGAIWLTRLLSGFLYGVTATDSATFVAVSLLLISAACIAAYFPARRAALVDPIIALRHE